MKLLALPDLYERWTYTKAGIHKLAKSESFPKPVATVCKGRIKIYRQEDVELYEKDRPWLLDEDQKIQRQKIYALLNLAKQEGKSREILHKLFGKKAVEWES